MPNSTESRMMAVHPQEERFLLYLREKRFITLERLLVQDGLPVLAEIVYGTVKFTEPRTAKKDSPDTP